MSNAAKLKKRAAEFEQKKLFDKALALYIQVLEEPGVTEEDADVALYNRVGDLLLRVGNVAEALNYYEKAVDLYAERGFLNNAIALCNKILRQSPARTSIYYKLGRISATKGFKSDAKKNFLEYADRMQHAGQIDEAFRALKEFADLCPDQDDIRLMLAEQLSKEGRKDESIEQLQKLHEKLEAEGRTAEARATAERMKAIDPSIAPRRSTTPGSQKSSDLVFLDLSFDRSGQPGAGGGAGSGESRQFSDPDMVAFSMKKGADRETPHIAGFAPTVDEEIEDGPLLDPLFIDLSEPATPATAASASPPLLDDDLLLDGIEQTSLTGADTADAALDDHTLDLSAPLGLELTASSSVEDDAALVSDIPLIIDMPPAPADIEPLVEELDTLLDLRTPPRDHTDAHDAAILDDDLAFAPIDLDAAMHAEPDAPREVTAEVPVIELEPLDDLSLDELELPEAPAPRALDGLSLLDDTLVPPPTPEADIDALTTAGDIAWEDIGVSESDLARADALPDEPIDLAPPVELSIVNDDALTFVAPAASDGETVESIADLPLETFHAIEPLDTVEHATTDAFEDVSVPLELTSERELSLEWSTPIAETDPAIVSDEPLEFTVDDAIEPAVEPEEPDVAVPEVDAAELLQSLAEPWESFDEAPPASDVPVAAPEEVAPAAEIAFDADREAQARIDYDLAQAALDSGTLDTIEEPSAPETSIDEAFEAATGEMAAIPEPEPARRSTPPVMAAFDTGELEAVNAAATASRASFDLLRERVDEAPADWGLRRALGESLLERGEREAGLQELERAMLGFDSEGDLESAQTVADELIALEPSVARLHQKCVEYAVRSGDRGRLIDAYLSLADALLRNGEAVKARAVYNRVIELAPENARAHAAMRAIGGEEEETSSEVWATPAMAAGPTSPASDGDSGADSGGFFDLGEELRADEAPRSTRMVTEEKPPTGDEQADFAEMLRKFKKGVAENVDEEDYESHYDLGVAYKEMGLMDEAVSEFQKALRGSTNRARTYEALGQCFVEKEQFQVAHAILSRTLTLGVEDDQQLVGVLYLLGVACEALDRRAEALGHYQRVFAVDIGFRDVADRISDLERVAQ